MLITVNKINVIKENNIFQPLGTVSFFSPSDREELLCVPPSCIGNRTKNKSILFILSIVVLLKLVNCKCITLDFSQLLQLLQRGSERTIIYLCCMSGIYRIHDNKADLI